MNNKLKNIVENIVGAELNLKAINNILNKFNHKKEKIIQIGIFDKTNYDFEQLGVAFPNEYSEKLLILLKEYKKYLENYLKENINYK